MSGSTLFFTDFFEADLLLDSGVDSRVFEYENLAKIGPLPLI